MNAYKTIILAVDLTNESEQVAERAAQLATNGGLIHLVHVVEPISFAYGGDIPLDFSSVQEEIQKQAELHMEKLAAAHQIPKEQQHLLVGRPESEVHSLAEKLDADVIVVGSHGRHGLALILGSTANGILHGAICDVLAVRISENENR